MTSHKNFKKAAGLMLVAVAASRFLGLIREMIIARQFGETGVVSAYTAAFNIPDLLYFFLSSGALSAAFIPVFTERFTTDRKKEAWQIFSIIACFMGIVLTGAVIVSWIFARPLVSVLAVPGFVDQHPELIPLTMTLTRIILPCQLFFFLGGLMMATLQSRQEFRATAAGPVIYNVGIIFGALILSRWFHIRGVAMGTLIGAFAGNIVYTVYWMRREGFEFYPSLNLRHPGVVRIAKLALPVIFGLGLPQIDVIVNKWFASFVSAAAPAALNYANRLMQVPLGIFAQAAGTAILPMLAAYAAMNALDDMRSGVGYGLRGIMVESIPATVFMIVMADPLVRTIFMGNKFLPSMVGPTVIPLIWYCVGIYAWAGQAIVARGFFALQDTITPVAVGTVSTLVFIPLNFFLMRRMGTGGIALATTIAVSLHFFGLTFFLRRRLHGIEGKKIASTVARVITAAAVMAVVCFGVRLGMSRAIGSWQLQDGDIRAPENFAVQLRNDRSPLSGYLFARLRVSDELNSALIGELNSVISGPSLYEKSGSPVPDNLASPAKIDLMKLNRQLLDKTYPSALAEVSDDSKSWFNRLLGIKPKPVTWVLKTADITDLTAFANRLLANRDPVSKFLNSRFSEGTKRMLQVYAAGNASTAELLQSLSAAGNRTAPRMIADYEAKQALSFPLRNALVEELNHLMRGAPLYDKERFARAGISSDLEDAAASNPTGENLLKLNRQLLDAAYPDTLVKGERADSWLSRMMGVPRMAPPAGGKWLVQDSDILDLQEFARQLLSRPDPVTHDTYINPVSDYLVSQFSPETNRMLRDYVAKCEASADLPQSFTHDLNEVINNDQLYTPDRFAGVTLAPRTLKMAERARSGKALARANRLLLEAAYPRDIVKRPTDRVESRMASLLTVLVAMVFGGLVYFALLRVFKVDEMDFLFSALKRRLTRRRGDNGNGDEPVEAAPMVD